MKIFQIDNKIIWEIQNFDAATLFFGSWLRYHTINFLEYLILNYVMLKELFSDTTIKLSAKKEQMRHHWLNKQLSFVFLFI